MNVCVCLCMYRGCTYVCMYECVCEYVSWLYICMYVYVCVCLCMYHGCTYLQSCIYVRMYVHDTQIHTHTHPFCEDVMCACAFMTCMRRVYMFLYACMHGFRCIHVVLMS
jgi:hypothetical protein